MLEYEIRVVGTPGPLAMSLCPGFSACRSVSLRGVADGEDAMVRTLSAILDRQLPGVGVWIRDRGADHSDHSVTGTTRATPGHRATARSRGEPLARSEDDGPA